MGKLNDRIAVITGGARGMGAATARLFASEGAKVVIADILEEGKALAQEIGSERAMFVHLDVTSEESWALLDSTVRAQFGVARVLVNNAGIVCYGEVIHQDYRELERVLRINVCGSFLGIKTLAPGMIAAGGGSIVNISSEVGLIAHNGLGAYAASKWAVRGMSKAAALELSHRGVRVNSVHPGPINTPMANPNGLPASEIDEMHRALPLSRAGQPEEVARATLFLASDDASYVTGAEFAVDGGMSAGIDLNYLPGTPDDKKARREEDR